jgi:hypothetical protein
VPLRCEAREEGGERLELLLEEELGIVALARR